MSKKKNKNKNKNKKAHQNNQNNAELNRLEKKQRTLEAEIRALETDIEKKYTTFQYSSSNNELQHLKKSNNKNTPYQAFNIPQYVLPEVGILFEDKKHYYLQIETEKALKQANQIAENRYINKPCSVVAKLEN